MQPQKSLIALFGCFVFVSSAGISHPPLGADWWNEGNPPAVVPGIEANNLGVANLGQGKWMALRAIDALHPMQPGIAQGISEDLRGAQVLDIEAELALPASPERYLEHRAPLLLGQLKALAKPFYDRLNALDPGWVLDQLQQNGLTVEGTHYWQVLDHPEYIYGGFYPWNPQTPLEENWAVAVIGQLKVLFSLRFSSLPVADNDGDGLPDAWEVDHGLDHQDDGNLDPRNGPDGDPDGDGSTNAEEFARGTDPNNRDTDGDGQDDPFDLDPNYPELGLLNANFDEEPGGEPDETWSEAKLWPKAQVRGWQSVRGGTIELKREEGRDFGEPQDYTVELHGHFKPDGTDTSHGVKQDFKMLKGSSERLILRYRGRKDPKLIHQRPDNQPIPLEKADNKFTIELEGKAVLVVDGQVVEDGVASFTGVVGEWRYAVITIGAIVDSDFFLNGNRIADLTLTLMPEATGNGNTHGAYVDLIPVQVIDKDSKPLLEIPISKMLGSNGEPTSFSAENLDRFRVRLLGGSTLPLEALWIKTEGADEPTYDDPEQKVLFRKEEGSWVTFDHVLVPSVEDDQLRNDGTLIDDTHIAAVDSIFVINKLEIGEEVLQTDLKFPVRFLGWITVDEFFLPDPWSNLPVARAPDRFYERVPEMLAQVGLKVEYRKGSLDDVEPGFFSDPQTYDLSNGFSEFHLTMILLQLGTQPQDDIQFFHVPETAADANGMTRHGFIFDDEVVTFDPTWLRTAAFSGLRGHMHQERIDEFLLAHLLLRALGGTDSNMELSEDPFNALFSDLSFRQPETWKPYSDFEAPKRLTKEQEAQILRWPGIQKNGASLEPGWYQP